jgi:hypothetical protein
MPPSLMQWQSGNRLQLREHQAMTQSQYKAWNHDMNQYRALNHDMN